MSRIETAAEQDEIANSLLGEPDSYAGDGHPETDGSGEVEYSDDSLEGQVADYLAGEDDTPAKAETAVESEEPEAEQFTEEIESHQEQTEETPTAPVEITPQAIEQSLQDTYAFIKEQELVDSEETAILASELGLDATQSAAAGQTHAALVVSGLHILEQAHWNVQNLQQLHPLQLRAVHDEVCRNILCIDPRLSPANPEAFGADVMFGMVNLLAAANAVGADARLDQINSPQMAEWFINRISQHFGNNQPVEKQVALRNADAFARHALSVVRKLIAQRAPAEQAQPARHSRTSARQSSSRSSGRSSRFTTNVDLFDDATLEIYHREHGRL